MKNWRENDLREKFDKFLSETYPKEVWGIIDFKLILPFISLIPTEAFKKVEEGLPKEKTGLRVYEYMTDDQIRDLGKQEGHNHCLIEVKEKIKEIKEKFL